MTNNLQESELLTTPQTTDTKLDMMVNPQSLSRCQLTPMLATGVLVGFLQQHFGNPESIVNPLLQQYIWRNGDDTSMMIETCSNDSLSRIGMMPAILVRRNKMVFNRIVLNDEMKSLTGERDKRYIIEITGSHTVNCIAPSPGHAESLAAETSLFLLEAGICLRGWLFTKDFQLQETGELFQLQNNSRLYDVPLTLTYVTDFIWKSMIEAPPLRHISVRTLFGL